MKAGFIKAGKIFKYLAIVFALIYWTYIIIDDWIFIEKYWSDHWLEGLGLWFAWFLIYFLAFSIYYWSAAAAIVFIYYKLIPGFKRPPKP